MLAAGMVATDLVKGLGDPSKMLQPEDIAAAGMLAVKTKQVRGCWLHLLYVSCISSVRLQLLGACQFRNSTILQPCAAWCSTPCYHSKAEVASYIMLRSGNLCDMLLLTAA